MTSSFPWSSDRAFERLGDTFSRADNDPGAQAVFTKLLRRRGKHQAQTAPENPHSLAGAIVSIKALFDVAGETTTSGAKVLMDAPPATSDAVVIARLDKAGAVFAGLTNMSEFAYSGLGLNPHFGTPLNAVFPGCAPGGSTSGGAVGVALGLCDIAIGSDTGGSLRIPAAFNGIVGFKPTQGTVPMTGGRPLSDSLDSFGPMARSVAACELAWQVMAGTDLQPVNKRPCRLVVPANFGLSEMDPVVAAGFEHLRQRLLASGLEIVEKQLVSIDLYGQVPPWHMTSVEARAHYERCFQDRPQDFDQRVHARMARADEISAVQYRQTLNRRSEFIGAFSEEVWDDILLLPTTPILPPEIDSLKDDATFNRLNLLALRNPSLVNVADGCGIALPFEHQNCVLSAMLIAPHGRDETLLACAKAVEAALSGEA
ncbi:aspartyl-tRNA(Asn)/glutamyl-tRNA(Gln) amidotransferase subunit A [Roseibium hamelinense]|uniref:Aspartyl-tRNA(Asn)/glutamyl-tRNA(Gln) amidotransferase subunit A n=1 Tax=Roseibium hamelinense TaxID=150831 RepID=A0A562SUM7_9HYPH|nr:amidase family protein [Roseibium hamelinense]MTI42410.1 amidase [Roseibium hamelinense]TWI84704.1 aspartyl-tRNA(Asn)/glutamyl-tRNA(Gln) amidotransferase subunit A [Roseibium hamelinense]